MSAALALCSCAVGFERSMKNCLSMLTLSREVYIISPIWVTGRRGAYLRIYKLEIAVDENVDLCLAVAIALAASMRGTRVSG